MNEEMKASLHNAMDVCLCVWLRVYMHVSRFMLSPVTLSACGLKGLEEGERNDGPGVPGSQFYAQPLLQAHMHTHKNTHTVQVSPIMF